MAKPNPPRPTDAELAILRVLCAKAPPPSGRSRRNSPRYSRLATPPREAASDHGREGAG